MLNQDHHFHAGSCTVEGILPYYRKACDNRPFCFAYAHVDEDPCPSVSKYLEIVYSCEQKGRLSPSFFSWSSLKLLKSSDGV